MTNNKKIHTGPNGGKYTLSKTGKKEYIGRVARGLTKKKEVSRNGASYARFAKRPCGIVGCALAQAKKKGWKCGQSSNQALSCKCKNCGK